jgi:Fe2+ or Zn2+ uptake regulation protein
LGEPDDITWPEPELDTALVDYLAEHPEAMDTADGIAEWWLTRQRIRVDLAALARVLSRLTDLGVLEKIGSDENARYRLRGHN